MSRRSRTSLFSGPSGFSLRRLILQGARAARGSPTLGQRCDIERGITSNSNSKHDKKHGEGTSTSYGNKTSNGENASTSRQNANNGLQQQNSIQSDDCSFPLGTAPNNSKAASISSPQRSDSTGDNNFYCQICYNTPTPPNAFYTLFTCKHTACRNCLERYLKNEINESRTDIACPQCSEAMHPSDIETLLKNYSDVITKYEDFMVRRFLLTDPDSRWCPAPDCSFAIIATGCASCPRIRCQRPGCGLHFCYHCKAEWHPDQTCDAARASRQSPSAQLPTGKIISPDIQHRNGDDIKPCPRCQVLIVKMDDGTCNHMVCSICGSEFCWLCMKEISDLHYLSPSGCTFWGKKPWSRKKKLMWQLGTLVGAPLGIALVAGIAVPAMIIGIPVWVGKKIFTRYKSSTKHRRNCAVVGGVLASIFVSPILAGLAVAIGVPILLFYVYGVVPVSLCRAGCGVSTTRDGFKFDFDEEEEENNTRNQSDGASVDAVSRIGGTSIGEVSLSVASGSHIVGVSNKGDGPQFSVAQSLSSKNESTTALAGSITGHRLEVQADVSLSETASAVTCISEKSGNISNDTASTKALAGSILSYRQQTNDYSNVSEDGISERNRVLDVAVTDQDSQVDKASVGSCRSFRSSEKSFRDDMDSTASSVKRLQFCARHTKPNPVAFRTMSLDSNNGTNYIPENVKLEKQAEEEECSDNNNMTDIKPESTILINREYVGDKPIIGTLIREIHFVEGTIYKGKYPNVNNSVGNIANYNNNNEISSSYSKSVPSTMNAATSTSANTTPTNSPNISPTAVSPDTIITNLSSQNINHNSPDGKNNPSKASILRNLFFAQKNDNILTQPSDNSKNSESDNHDVLKKS
ncbi:E3 ubiquitin-protein ligase RNF19B-like [Condylostylus longicornis]|uniref:E3 ubiquitin-protein ligase RNF19B-like n=1 Tax=Condylostylus longicornis TaxID=2530218 RepID=UPI00244E3BC1|nr:E3 ubiquitin-protein ligase RNF19B-like [Condylostylus longicornis]